MSKKYTEDEKRMNREKYMESRKGDLTSYAGMLGEGFSSAVNLLAQIIGEAHEPSLGAYKERLLMDKIAQFIPKKYDVGTGFVLFPEPNKFEIANPSNSDYWNFYGQKVSKQLDIIVYDSTDFPVIFKDKDFVVL